MYPIAGPGATVDNKFTEGDPVSGVPATVVTDDWANDVQAEILNVMAGASPAVVPAIGVQNQLLLAVQRIATAASTPTVQGVRGAYSNLRVSTSGTSPLVSLTADRVTLENASGSCVTRSNVSVSINTATIGINGLSTGTLAASTWYAVWLWDNGTTVVGTADASFTTPTAPAAGYVSKGRFSAFRTDASANKYPLSYVQMNSSAQYKVATGSNVPNFPLVTSGSVGNANTGAYVASPVATWVPPSASQIDVYIYAAASNGLVLASSNAATGAGNSSTNPAPLQSGQPTGGASTASSRKILLETTNVYFSSNVPMFAWCLGWEDNL